MIKFHNSATDSVFVLPSSVREHLSQAGEKDLKVLIYVFSCGMNTESEEEIASSLGIPLSDVYEALAFWRGTGIFTYKKEEKSNVTVISKASPSQKNTSYTPGDIADALERDEDIRSLFNFASQKLGKILTPSEQASIFYLLDTLSMPCDLVMGIIEYFTSKGKKNARYIERAAIRMYEDDGIDSYQKFEEYVTAKNKASSLEENVRRIIGATGRAFTKKESEIIERWSKDNTDPELISAAYERTVTNIGKASLNYMSKILESWRQEGIEKPEDLENQQPFDPAFENSSMSGSLSLEDFAAQPKKE